IQQVLVLLNPRQRSDRACHGLVQCKLAGRPCGTCWPLSHILFKRNPIAGWWHLRFKKISLLASLDWDESHRPRGADWVIRVAQRHFRRPTRRALWQRIKVGDFTFTRPGPNSASASFAWELVDAEKLRFKKKRGSR